VKCDARARPMYIFGLSGVFTSINSTHCKQSLICIMASQAAHEWSLEMWLLYACLLPWSSVNSVYFYIKTYSATIFLSCFHSSVHKNN